MHLQMAERKKMDEAFAEITRGKEMYGIFWRIAGQKWSFGEGGGGQRRRRSEREMSVVSTGERNERGVFNREAKRDGNMCVFHRNRKLYGTSPVLVAFSRANSRRANIMWAPPKRLIFRNAFWMVYFYLFFRHVFWVSGAGIRSTKIQFKSKINPN